MAHPNYDDLDPYRKGYQAACDERGDEILREQCRKLQDRIKELEEVPAHIKSLVTEAERIVRAFDEHRDNLLSKGAIDRMRAALMPPKEPDPDLTKCPNCGGDADNGFDRCIPPNPYHCTKCDKPKEGGTLK